MKKIFGKNQLMITALALMIAVAGYLHFAGDMGNQITITDSGDESDGAQEAANMTEYTYDEYLNLDDENAEEVSSIAETNDDLVSVLDISDEDLTDIDSLDEDMDLAAADTEYEDELAQVDEEPLQKADSSDVQAGEIPGEAVFTSTMTVNTLQSAKLLKEQTRAENKQALLDIINNANIEQEQKTSAVESMVNLTAIAEKEMSAEILLSSKGFDDAVVSITGESADVVVNASELTDAQRAQIEDIVVRKTGILAENIVISTTLN